jgi:transposase, IS5 family
VVKAAKAAGIALKQTFAAEGKELLRKSGRYAHAKQFKRLKKVVKRERTILGVVLRKVQRKLDVQGQTVAVDGAPDKQPARATALGALLLKLSHPVGHPNDRLWQPAVWTGLVATQMSARKTTELPLPNGR